jgi:hypothetical protein
MQIELKSGEKETCTANLSNVLESDIRASMPRILEILLLDRTTSTTSAPNNIIWANDNYVDFDASVAL